MMGKTYGRTHYWIWNSGYLHRIICYPGGMIKNSIAYVFFSFKDKPEYGHFYIDNKALAKTKADAYAMNIDTREYNYERLK